MPPDLGTRIGVFEITGSLGAGGMGEVYRARDSRLKRDVALKILPELFAADSERLARFQREAELLASLNHPHIAAIYGLEESAHVRALVLELVEGETLADRIARGPMPVDDALPIAREIAEALEAAHEQGIIHRDLKPANIKITPAGAVKVLDFGLAKLAEPAAATAAASPHALSMSPTITSPAMATGIGVLLGTAAYMSPEQAKGRPADKRADMWAFGCVLFEMLTGKRAFDGGDLTEVLGAVVRLDPDWSALPPATPSALHILLRTCLAKDRRMRRIEATAALFVLDNVPALAGVPAPREPLRPGSRRMAASTAAAFLLGASLSGAAVWWATRAVPSRVVRSEITTGGPMAFATTGDKDLAITPDGTRIIYRGINELNVRTLDALEPALITGLGAPRGVFVSPDGDWIGFFDGNSVLKKVAMTGGPPVTVSSGDGFASRGGTWGPDGSIVYATSAADTGLVRVSASGGESAVLTTPNREGGEGDHVWPEFLPDGRGVLFTILGSGGLDNAQIAVLDLASGTSKVVVRGGHHAHYVATGHLVYGANGTLRAVAFDLGRREAAGAPVRVLEGVLTTTAGAVDAAVAADGTLVYVSGRGLTGGSRSLVWVTRDGREEPIPAPPRMYVALRLSPDGTRAAIDTADQENDLWVWNFARQTLTRLTFAPVNDDFPVWTPDGRRIIFSRAGLWSRAADGTGPEERMTTVNALATSFAPDGKQLVVTVQNDIGLLPLDGSGHVSPLVQTRFNEGHGEISPDGKWLAYQSNESGQDQVYVQPFPDVGSGRWQVSPAGGGKPLWARNGRELFYLDGTGALVAVPVQTQPVFTAGNPAKLFDARYLSIRPARSYDVTPDGQRFLFIENAPVADSSGAPAAPTLVIVQNWTEELKRLVPTN